MPPWTLMLMMMLGDGATLSELEDLESRLEATPHDHGRGAPPQSGPPRGPPPPQPVHPRPAAASADPSADASTPPEAMLSDEDSDPSRRWPMLAVSEGGHRFYARVQGPPLPSGKFEASSDSSSSVNLSSSDSQASASLNSLTWSETSLVLGGPSLAEAKGVLCSQYRMELLASQPGISSRSQGARVGVLRRRLQDAPWHMVQQLAHQHLTAERRQSWSNWEFQATHERRPRRGPPAP